MPDLSIYAGRWIALTEVNEVAAVGATLEDTRCAARAARPKERLRFAWVSPHPPYLPLPEWPLVQLRSVLPPTDVWLAGGPVRDLLLGKPLHDWDFAVRGNATAMARKAADVLKAAYYPLDEERDAGRAVAKDPVSRRPITLDFASLRGATLEEDLRLRDFTINAMALTLEGELIDPTNGQSDLQQRLIRATSERSFTDDPVRLLRAVRQANTLDFNLEAGTELAIRAQAPAITAVTPERISAVLQRLVSAVPAPRGLQALGDLGLLGHVLPEVHALQAAQQSWPHYYSSVWVHTLGVISALEGILSLVEGKPRPNSVAAYVPAPGWTWSMLAEVVMPFQAPLLAYLNEPVNADMPRADLLKWGALFHDTGKALTRTVDEEGLTHFYGHAEVGAEHVRLRLEALRFPNRAIAYVETLVGHHMRLIGLSKVPPTPRAAHRFYRSAGDAGVGIVLLALADTMAVWARKLEEKRWRALLHAARTLLTAYFEQQEEVIAPPPLLNGYDLIAIGIRQGPEIGRALEALREAQAAGEITTREAAEIFIQTHFIKT